jgi:hypothetical protein
MYQHGGSPYPVKVYAWSYKNPGKQTVRRTRGSLRKPVDQGFEIQYINEDRKTKKYKPMFWDEMHVA